MTGVPLSPQSRVARPARVLFREIRGEAVLFDPRAGTYFALDEVGTEAWTAMDEPTSLADVRDRIVAAFEVDEDRAWRDLLAFATDLVEHGLLDVEAT